MHHETTKKKKKIVHCLNICTLYQQWFWIIPGFFFFFRLVFRYYCGGYIHVHENTFRAVSVRVYIIIIFFFSRRWISIRRFSVIIYALRVYTNNKYRTTGRQKENNKNPTKESCLSPAPERHDRTMFFVFHRSSDMFYRVFLLLLPVLDLSIGWTAEMV